MKGNFQMDIFFCLPLTENNYKIRKITTILGGCRACELRLGSELIKEQDSCRLPSCRLPYTETPGSLHTPPSSQQTPS